VYFSLKVPISYGVETHWGVIWASGGGVVLVLFQNASHGSLRVKKVLRLASRDGCACPK